MPVVESGNYDNEGLQSALRILSAKVNRQMGRPTVAFVGDSIQYAAIGGNATNSVFNANRGPSFWARFLTSHRIASGQSLNFGVSGDKVADVLARMAPILAANPQVYYLAIGTNDAGVTAYATWTAQYLALLVQLMNTGATVICSTILPRTLATQSTRDAAQRMNIFIRSLAGAYDRVFVTDPTINYGDPTAADWSPRTSYSYDGLHPKGLGAYHATKPLVSLLNMLYPPVGVPMALPADVFSAANPGGNLLTNGILAYTSGGTNGGGGGTISGNITDAWTLATSANGGTLTSLTVTGSTVALPDGRSGQGIAIGGSCTANGSTPINSGSLISFKQDKTSAFTNYVAGDRLVFSAEVAADATTASISGIEAQLVVTVGGVTYTNGDGSCYTGDLLPSEAFSGVLRTPDFILPSGTITLVRCAVRIYLLTGSISPVLAATIAGLKLAKV